jgi:hypothetical protein
MKLKVWFMVLNATFNSVSVIAWRSVLLDNNNINHEKKNSTKLGLGAI